MTYPPTKGERSNLAETLLQMKQGPVFTIVALLSLLASVAMAMDNNWSGVVFGLVAAIFLFVMAIV
jgi:ABC-type arginine/histidine transport system permease subunit